MKPAAAIYDEYVALENAIRESLIRLRGKRGVSDEAKNILQVPFPATGTRIAQLRRVAAELEGIKS